MDFKWIDGKMSTNLVCFVAHVAFNLLFSAINPRCIPAQCQSKLYFLWPRAYWFHVVFFGTANNPASCENKTSKDRWPWLETTRVKLIGQPVTTFPRGGPSVVIGQSVTRGGPSVLIGQSVCAKGFCSPLDCDWSIGSCAFDWLMKSRGCSATCRFRM